MKKAEQKAERKAERKAVRKGMSEREPGDARLDEALRLLYRAERDSDGSLSEVRERVLAAARAQTRTVEPVDASRVRRRWSPVAAAAAVLMLIAFVPLLTSQRDEQPSPPTVPAATGPKPLSAHDVFERAALAAASRSETALESGWYRYIAEYDWVHGQGGSSALGQVRELWVPSNRHDEWRLSLGNSSSSVPDHAPAAEPEQRLPDHAPAPGKTEQQRIPNPDTRARCGRFSDYPAIDCADARSAYSDAFYAGLPGDGAALLDALPARSGRPGADVWQVAVEVLRTGMVPRAVRARLYRGLAGLPGIQVADRRATLGERTGVALGLERAGERETRLELVVDPGTGEFLGTRTRSSDGQLLRARAVTVAVVDGITARPGS